MKKKFLNFSFIILIFSISLFFVVPQVQFFRTNQTEVKTQQAKDLSEFESFFKLMDQIKDENGSSDRSNDMVKYVASSKTYYLEKDLNFNPLIESGQASKIYDGTYDVSLVEGSTFNGNNHKIINRYDKDALNSFINTNQQYFYSLFAKSSSLDTMYFFQPVTNASIVNLTFDNSPFVASKIGEGTIHNVNMVNVDLSNLTINFNSAIDNQKQAINIPLFISQVGSGVNISNSYFNNIKIENNVFNIEQSTTQAVNIIFSINGWLYKVNDSNLNTVYSDIEMSNWTIANNEVKTNKWSTSGFSQSSLMFTPFITSGVRYTNATWSKDDLSSTSTRNDMLPKSTYEVSLFIKNIYMNNFYIANNLKTNGSNSSDNFNISFYPFYNDDDLLNIFYDTFLLNNIRFENQTVISEFYKTSSKNTIYINNNLHYLSNIDDQLKTILTDWEDDDANLINDPNYKATKFNTMFWDVSGANLSLKTNYQFDVDNQIIYENNAPTINLNSELNNFLPTIFEVELFKNDVLVQTYDLTSEINTINFTNNVNTQVDISLIFVEDFTWQDQVSLHFKLSEANPLLDFTIAFDNQTNNSYIYDFQNTYNKDTKTLSYEFKILDPFSQVNGWTLNAYDKNKKIFTLESDSMIKTNKSAGFATISGEETNLNLKNANSLYFVFDLELNSQTQAIVPGNNFQLGEINYINEFLTSPHPWVYYYWWVILILVLILIFIVIIIIGILNAKKQRSKINQIETAMAVWAQEHDDSDAFNEYITGIALVEEEPQDDYRYDYDESNYQDDDYGYDEQNYGDADSYDYNQDYYLDEQDYQQEDEDVSWEGEYEN